MLVVLLYCCSGFLVIHLDGMVACQSKGHVTVCLPSALDFGQNSLGLRAGWGTVLSSWARHFTLTVPSSTQVYKWVPANLMLG